jgi:hypothetical protein
MRHEALDECVMVCVGHGCKTLSGWNNGTYPPVTQSHKHYYKDIMLPYAEQSDGTIHTSIRQKCWKHIATLSFCLSLQHACVQKAVCLVTSPQSLARTLVVTTHAKHQAHITISVHRELRFVAASFLMDYYHIHLHSTAHTACCQSCSLVTVVLAVRYLPLVAGLWADTT